MSEQTNTWGGTETTKGTGPLFVVRRPRFPGVIFTGLGAAAVVIGIPGIVIQQLVSPGANSTSLGFMAGLGALLLLFGLALGATRVDVYDRHYDVKSGFGKLRRREVDDIRTLRYATQSNGGGQRFVSLTAWNDRKKKQFMIFTNYRGYQEFTAWLAERRPKEWAECERLGIPD